ncbi:MAG TPA: hypothetical protein PLL98_01905 [Bacillota bacterium]|nr:hypothetical protein [Bacillota bacterium]HOR85218.1 hypothetical protein [Bacillota bacterium]HPL53411.1 hypothetical protein [Bacillota bacterium]
MTNRFSRGLYCKPVILPAEPLPKKHSENNELLILIILFILLAASPSLGLESRFFFIIIMAIIGLGGVNKVFGLNSR